MDDVLYATPRPTYIIGYSATIQSGGWGAGIGKQLEIPNHHRREGDLEDNLVASYVLTYVPFAAPGNLFVYDESAAPCFIVPGNASWLPVPFVQSSPLKLACENQNVTVYVRAAYYKPIGR